MSGVLEFLGSEAGISLIAWIVGLVWTALKGTEFWQARVDARVNVAIDAILAGVKETYDTYAEKAKAARPNGKLTLEERKIARDRALEKARELAAAQGIDLLKTLGPEQAKVWIERSINILKGKVST